VSAALPTVPEPIVRVSQYEVCAHPDPDSINYHLYVINVEHRGGDRWAISRHRQCLGKRGNWSWESNPSSRTDRWLNAYRHDLDVALDLARKEAPKVTVNGLTAAACWEWEKSRQKWTDGPWLPVEATSEQVAP
jgi:hypothetical protein